MSAAMNPTVQRVLVAVPGARLDAQIHVKREGDLGLLLVHPYPLLGGSMFDPVVTEVFRNAVACDTFSCVLRYNMRGVGQSSGSKSLRGKADGQDVEEMCSFLLNQLFGSNKRVFVVGYSWGACVATRALSCPRVTAYVGISFPLGGLAVVLQPRKHFATLCAAAHMPRLLVIGSQDQYTKHAALQQLVLQQPGGATYDSWAATQRQQLPETAAVALHSGPDLADSGGAEAPAGSPRLPGSLAQQQVQASSLESLSAGGLLHERKEADAYDGINVKHQPLAAQPHQQTQQQRPGTSICVDDSALNLPQQDRAALAPAPLLVKSYPGSDHFWMEEGIRMAEGVVGWLEQIARTQRP